MKTLTNKILKTATGFLLLALLAIPVAVSAGECEIDPGENDGVCVEDVYENEFCAKPGWWDDLVNNENCVQGDVEGDGDEEPGIG